MTQTMNTQTVNVLSFFTQQYPSGGINTPPEARIFLLALASLVRAKRILETGFDAGYTTRALALSGAQVIAIDNGCEYPEATEHAVELLKEYSNVQLGDADALDFIRACPDECFDFIFIDDYHGHDHVRQEALEVRRLLRPGGIVAFHDTNLNEIYKIIQEIFGDWEHLTNLPCISTYSEERNFGLGLAIKPSAVRKLFRCVPDKDTESNVTE